MLNSTLSPCSMDLDQQSFNPAKHCCCQDSRQCLTESTMRGPPYQPHSQQRHCAITRRSSMGRSLFTLLVCVLPFIYHDSMSSTNTSVLFVRAEKDSNPYPYGENPNNVFKMYWNDAGNIMQDLSKFSSLYIRYHGCVWSECQVDSFDDDGENRDGGTSDHL